MKRLLLSAIPDDFNPQNDILSGPWCFLGKEHLIYNGDDFEFEPDPFDNVDDIVYHAKLTTEYAESYMYALASQLNEINQTNHSRKFWRLLVFPWLLSLVQSTWERQLRINSLLKKYSNVELEIELIKDNIIWDFRDTLDHQRSGLLKHLYNHWLYSRLLESNIPSKWRVKWVNKNYNSSQNFKQKNILKRKVIKWYGNNFLLSNVYGIGRSEAFILELFIRLKSLFISYNNNKDSDKYKTINLKWNLDWGKLVQATIPDCFKNIEIKGEPSSAIRIFIVGPNSVWYEENHKLKLAQAIERGSKIITTQHGGGYGTSIDYPFTPSIEYIHYKFISWGWTEQEDYRGNIIPLPSPLLSKYKYKKKNNNIILISTYALVYSFRFDYIPQASQQIEYINSRMNFIDSINNAVYKNLYYRLFHIESGSLSDKAYVRKKYPDLKILEGNLHKETMKCQLLIVDHPDTTLNIALAANIPTVCFWDKDVLPMCRQAEPYFEELRKVGILYNNGKEAAEKVNEIWGDVEGWWRQSHIQKAREEWCWQYARTSKNWRWEWIKTLWKLGK